MSSLRRCERMILTRRRSLYCLIKRDVTSTGLDVRVSSSLSIKTGPILSHQELTESHGWGGWSLWGSPPRSCCHRRLTPRTGSPPPWIAGGLRGRCMDVSAHVRPTQGVKHSPQPTGLYLVLVSVLAQSPSPNWSPSWNWSWMGWREPTAAGRERESSTSLRTGV